MKSSKFIILKILILFLLFNCGGAKSEAELAKENRDYNNLKALVDTKAINFKAKASFPMQSNAVVNVTTALLRTTGSNGSRQDLTGNGDYIKVIKDSVSGDLAYFGELRVAGYASANDAGIKFNGEPINYVVLENDKKKDVTIKFKIKNRNEQFDVVMVLFPNKSANVSIYSANRTGIRYSGTIESVDVDEDL